MSDRETTSPLLTGGLADYHCHCDYSIDATGSIDEYCQAAIRKGLAGICFTTHYDSNPTAKGEENFIRVKGENRPATPENLASYVNDVRRAADRYLGDGLIVKLGVEFGWYAGCEAELGRLRDQYEFDHVLCGIHEIEDICFCCRDAYTRCFDRYPVEQMAEKYFAQALAAAESGLVDAIAHLDYYRKYGERFYGDVILEVHRPYQDELFSALRSTNTALEINTAGRRKGLSDYFPRVEVLTAAKRAGVEVRFLGSDAHSPADIGYDFDTAVHLLSDNVVACEQ